MNDRINIELKNILRYIWDNKLTSLFFLYCIIAILLKSLSIVNITIPCLWTTIFGMKCFGCGLTTACIELSHFDAKGAFDTNPLVFVVVPALIYYIITDYFKFKKKLLQSEGKDIQA